MKKSLLSLVFSALVTSVYSITVSVSMNFDSTVRDFLVHLPTGYNFSQHLPVVFNLHGSGSNAAQEEFYSAMDETADSNHFIVCYPNGIGNVWNSGFTPPYNGGTDDVGFISKIIDTLVTLYNIDQSRVYACGMSNGGFQSYRLACDLENRIAAIASVAGTITDLTVLNCVLSRKIPVLHIHGTDDPLVPYGGEPGIKSVEETISFWLAQNQCSAVNDTVHYADIDPTDSSTVERIHYANCGAGTEVMFYKITGGGHTWPNAPYPYIYGPTNHDFDGSQEIWDFFNRFTLNGPAAVEEAVETAPQVKVFPNPFTESCEVQLLKDEFKLPLTAVLFDISGRKIDKQQMVAGAAHFYLTDLEKGIYFLKVEGKGFSVSRKVVKE